MRTRHVLNVTSLAAIFNLGLASCTITAAPAGGTGGAAGASGASSSAGATSSSGGASMCAAAVTPAPPAAGATQGPCDIYAADGGPCVAAHSMVRALYASYDGPLYQVKKMDGTTMDIGVVAPGGFVNSADQDTFCGTDACTISVIYDQSGHGNNLTSAPGGGAKTTPDLEANAKSVSATFNGHKVYGVHIIPGVGYRNNTPCGTATGDDPETEYMVVDGSAHNGGCCFDYGNMETSSRDDGEGTMEAVYYGTCTIWGKGAGDGPWVMGDLENGLWAGNVSPYANSMPVTTKYVTAMVKGDKAGSNHWTIKIGDAQSGVLTTPFDGTRPSARYIPMRKQGAVGLGTGGDNSSGAVGNFFEGIMTSAYASSAADDAVQANIITVFAP